MRRRLRNLLCPLLALTALTFAFGVTATAASPVGGKYRSYAYLAISRSGAAVYVNALVHQDSAAGLKASPNRTVYLQRLLAGHWQNVLTRHTDAHGRFTVGFPSAPSYSYRLVALAGTGTLSATSGTAASPLLGGRLLPGQALVAGNSMHDSVRSPSGQFRLSIEPGGMFGLTQDAYLAGAEKTISASVREIDGVPSTGKNRLTMQPNGDLVMSSATGKLLWSSHTSGAGNTLYVQEDGNVAIYSRLSRAVWSMHTTPVVITAGNIIPAGMRYISDPWPQTSPGFIGRLEMQRDGNLVLYGKTKLIWASNTHIAGSHAAFTVNGTLAVYSPGGTVLSRSPSYGAYSALIVDCGYLQVFPRYGAPEYFPKFQDTSKCGT